MRSAREVYPLAGAGARALSTVIRSGCAKALRPATRAGRTSPSARCRLRPRSICLSAAVTRGSVLFATWRLKGKNTSDFTQCFRRILEVVRREMERGTTVLFNVSSGVRVPVLVGCMVATVERCKVVQVIPEHFRLKDGMYAAEGDTRIIEIPKIPVELPAEEEKAVLFTLRELGYS